MLPGDVLSVVLESLVVDLLREIPLVVKDPLVLGEPLVGEPLFTGIPLAVGIPVIADLLLVVALSNDPLGLSIIDGTLGKGFFLLVSVVVPAVTSLSFRSVQVRAPGRLPSGLSDWNFANCVFMRTATFGSVSSRASTHGRWRIRSPWLCR